MTLELKDGALFRQSCYIDGAWTDADNGATVEVNNPATDGILGTIPKLGAEETRATKEALGWPLEPTFLVPAEARVDFEQAAARGRDQNAAWKAMVSAYGESHPKAAADLERRLSRTDRRTIRGVGSQEDKR